MSRYRVGAIRENILFLWRDLVLGIRIRRIYMFLGLPDPDPLFRGTDPDPHENATDPQHCRDPYQKFPIGNTTVIFFHC
jgi:hypothetical protein